MASNFPASLDSFTNPSSTDAMDSVSVPHATQHSDLNDAVEALQAKVGADSSAVASSHDYKIAQLEALGEYTDYSGSITFTNITLGNGTINYARYATFGNMVHYYGKITFGSTTSVTGNVEISAPFSAANEQPGAGNVQLIEDGVAAYVGFGRSNSNYFTLYATLETGSRVKWANVTATVPFTWGNLDRIAWTLVYEKA